MQILARSTGQGVVLVPEKSEDLPLHEGRESLQQVGGCWWNSGGLCFIQGSVITKSQNFYKDSTAMPMFNVLCYCEL